MNVLPLRFGNWLRGRSGQASRTLALEQTGRLVGRRRPLQKSACDVVWPCPQIATSSNTGVRCSLLVIHRPTRSNFESPIGVAGDLWVPSEIDQAWIWPILCGDLFPGRGQIHVSATVILSATTLETKNGSAPKMCLSNPRLWPPRPPKCALCVHESHTRKSAHIARHLQPPESIGYLAPPGQALRVLSAPGVALAPLPLCGAKH